MRQNIYLAWHCLAVLPLGSAIIWASHYQAIARAWPSIASSSHAEHPLGRPWSFSPGVLSAARHRASPHRQHQCSTLPANLDPSTPTDSEAVDPRGWADLPAVQLLSRLISERLTFDVLLLPFSCKAISICAVLYPYSSLGNGLGLLFAAHDPFLVCRSAVIPTPTLLPFELGMGKLWGYTKNQTENSLKRRGLQFDYF